MDINSELKDAQLEILDADNTYSANRKGLIWFNRTTDKVKAIFNSAIKILATEEYVDNGITALTNTVNDNIDNGLITTERSDPSTPASGKIHLYGKTDGMYTIDDGGSVERLYTQADVDGRVGMTAPQLSGEGTISINGGAFKTFYTAPSKGIVYIDYLRASTVGLNTRVRAGSGTPTDVLVSTSNVKQSYSAYLNAGEVLQYYADVPGVPGLYFRTLFVPIL